MTTRLEASLHQILSCPRQRLGQLFYDDFLASCPDAAPYFAGLNLDMQAKVLINTLQAIVAYQVHRYPAADSYLVMEGNRHHQRRIPEGLYPKFRDAMLRTLAGFHGSDWDADLEAEWRAAFGIAIEAMLRGYVQQHLTY